MKPAKGARASTRGPTDEGKAAKKHPAKELKAGEAARESDLLPRIVEMADRAMARRVSGVIEANVPALSPRPWRGVSAHATGDGKTIGCPEVQDLLLIFGVQRQRQA